MSAVAANPTLLLSIQGVASENQKFSLGLLATPANGTFRWHLRRILLGLRFTVTKHQTLYALIKQGWSKWLGWLQELGLSGADVAGKPHQAKATRFLRGKHAPKHPPIFVVFVLVTPICISPLATAKTCFRLLSKLEKSVRKFFHWAT